MWTMLVAHSLQVSTGAHILVPVASWLVCSSHSKELKDLKIE
jgi:hypothetical protein